MSRERLNLVFEKMQEYDGLEDRRERIIKKSATILAGISYQQAFDNGNKELALIIAIDFLNANDMDLPLEGNNARKQLEDLLIKVIFKFEKDPIYTEIEQYLQENVVELKR